MGPAIDETHVAAARTSSGARPKPSRGSLVTGTVIGLVLVAWSASSGVAWIVQDNSAASFDRNRPARTIIR